MSEIPTAASHPIAVPATPPAAGVEPAGIRLGVVRGNSYGLFGTPDDFVAAARRTGAGLIRAYRY
jgi:hypothetical protein